MDVQSHREPPAAMPRRQVLRQGTKLVYVAPVVLAPMKVESTFAASGGETSPRAGGQQARESRRHERSRRRARARA